MTRDIRQRFSIPEDIAYFNCAYFSPLLDSVATAGVQGMQRKARPWELTAKDFFEETEEARRLFASMIGASADDVALIPSVSYGVGSAAQALQAGPNDTVLVLDEQFPSNVYPWLAVGARVVHVGRPWTEQLLAALDRETVSIVAIPHGHWTDGTRVDLLSVSARCRELGVALVVDATQSLGAVPFDVRTIQPDFVITAVYKWLLGPYSVGFIYAAPRWHEAAPLEHNWINRADSEDFSGLVQYRKAFQPGARRFDVGERSNFILVPMVNAALRQILDWKVERIHTRLTAMTDEIAARATEAGLSVAPKEQRLGNMIGLRFTDGVPPSVRQNLIKNQVFVSQRGDSIRVAPHLYNNAEDIDRLFASLRS